jgi:hypothetical protein
MFYKRVKHYILSLVLLSACFVSLPGPREAAAAPSPDISFIKVNGEKVIFPDGQPFIESGRTLVPVRFIAEALGHKVDWIQETRTVTIDDGEILLPIGSTTATVNGETVTLDVPAKLLESRTYVPLRFISENLDCTVDWFNANRSIIINEKLPKGKEVSLYDRCKQSELFYEKVSSYNPEWDSYLYFKECLKEQTREACLDAEWFIGRCYSQYPDGIVRESGSDIAITIKKPSLKTRLEVKILLMTFYPTGFEEVYDILMKVAREEIFENSGMIPNTICGTYGTQYIDNREVVINKLYSTLNISIEIKDVGYINPKKPYLWPDDILQDFINNGVSHRESGKWYMETYQLDQW